MKGDSNQNACDLSEELFKAVNDFNKESSKHEHKALVARQCARELIERGQKKAAKGVIGQILEERKYVLACAVVARRLQKFLIYAKDKYNTDNSFREKYFKCLNKLNKRVKEGVIFDIEEELRKFEETTGMKPASSSTFKISEFVFKEESFDFKLIMKELETEVDIIEHMSFGKHPEDYQGRPRENSESSSDDSESNDSS